MVPRASRASSPHWAQAHPAVAAAWVKADKLNTDYVAEWQKDHPRRSRPGSRTTPPRPSRSPRIWPCRSSSATAKANPGTFPAAVEQKSADGKVEKRIEPVKEGADIQGGFFDLWLQEHPDADLEPVPADMVMASGSGLDPHITLKNALYQLDRVAAKWAADTKRDAGRGAEGDRGAAAAARRRPRCLGLAGVDLVNVLEVNLALRQRYAR